MPGFIRCFVGITGLAVLAYSPAMAAILRMDYQTNRLQGRLRQAGVEVIASQQRDPATDFSRPVAIVRVNGKEVGRLNGAERLSYVPAAVVQIAEMDPANPYPEVLLSSFTGGAHCCNQIQVLTSDRSGQKWREVSLGPFDDGESPARDPLGNGRYLIVDIDNRFLYRFGCYACSEAPLRLWQLQGDTFVDLSHRPEFRPLHRRRLAQMQARLNRDEPSTPNAFLAGYVATKALLGELDDGWKRMLSLYNRKSDTGLMMCKDDLDDLGECPGPEVRYASFPLALRAFLEQTGYIKPR